MAAVRMQNAIRAACSTCDKRRHYFDDFYVPGIAQRTAELKPVFDLAQSKLEKLTHRIRVMDGDRYVGFMRRNTPR